MLKRTIAPVFVTALLCLFAFPATAWAAGNAPATLVVGNVTVDTSQAGYWTTDADGDLAPGNESDYNVRYDAGSNTLTLSDATITASNDSNNNPSYAGIYATASEGKAVSLNIVAEGANTVSGAIGIYVYSASTGTASLTIEGDGSLNASGSRIQGILVQSNGGDATLTIQNANVEATVTGVAGNGVIVQAGSASSGGHTAKLEVNGGSLTATGGSSSGLGIHFYGPSASNIQLSVSNNAIVRADGGIASGAIADEAVATGGTGIVFNNDQGTVYGDVTLQEDLKIGEGESLTLDDGASLNAGNHNVIVDGGTLDESLKTSLGDSVKYTPAITTESLPDGIVDTSYNQTLAATGSDAITWSASGSLPAGLSLNGNTGAITGTPTVTGSSTFTVTAQNSYGSDSRELSVTISARATVPVTGVSLDRSALTLSKGDTARLTATVEPADATNQNVTWASSAPDVATVDASGNVTAVAEGTATITATTDDGGKTATCTVTVEHAHDPAAGWSSDASGHWHACAGCGEKLDFAAHSGKVVGKRDATCTEAGYTGDSVCSICGYVVAEGVATAATGHSYQNGVCTACGAKEPAKDEDAIPATGDLAPMACALLGIFGIAFVAAGLRNRTPW